MQQPELEAARHVLAYFVRNATAADNVEGVARWRLLEERVHSTLQTTESALSWLVSQGFLEQMTTAGGNHVFRMNPKRMDDARVFLAQGGEQKRNLD